MEQTAALGAAVAFSQVYISGVSEGSRARTVFFDVDLYWTSAILLPILRKLYESPNRLAP